MRFEQITEINKAQYQEQVLAHGSFLQDFEWGDFQKSQGRTVYRFAVFDGQEILASAQAIEHAIGSGKTYLFMPQGPVANLNAKNWQSAVGFLLEQISAKFPNAIFLRIEPQFAFDLENFANLNFKKSLNLNPAKTLLLDLKKSEQELLSEMSQSTRRKLRIAEKAATEGRLQIKTDQIENVWQPHLETARRAGIRAYSSEYYSDLAKYFSRQSCNIQVKVYSAWCGDQVIASNLMLYYKSGTAVYLFGGSSDSHRELSAPFLLQWQAIKDARAAGFSAYDFWGIEDQPGHSWAGITQFKRGFGGRAVQRPGTFDLVLRSAWYTVYKAARKSARAFNRILKRK